MKRFLLGLTAIFLGLGITLLNKVNNQTLYDNDNNNLKNIRSIHADSEDITLKESIEKSELVVEVEILEKVKEIGTDDETVLPKTIHLARIISVLKGTTLINSEINIFQDGVSEALVNGIPIYQSNEKYIFILNKAEPENEFPNTYWAQKVYFENNEQLISLNYGEEELSNFEVESNENEIIEKLDEIAELTVVEESTAIVLNKENTLETLKEVIANEE